MENWKDFISDEIRQLINLDGLGKNYAKLIKNNMVKGDPEKFAIRGATTELKKHLIGIGIKPHDAVHLLHFCGMAVYPAMYSGCGCHENPFENNENVSSYR